ncbi:MAG: agmatinase [Odoribacter sp.]|nr:agmatinase [Odoribacter sp.]MDY3033902.1 agmatinase [Odoribacter sp.]
MAEKTLYGDFEEKYTNYETAEIAILPVPYDGTSTWIKGADKGPQALLEASFNLEFYDIETDSEVFKKGIATLDAVTENSSPEAMADEVERRMNTILDDKKFPVLLGGEHSVSVGAFRAVAKHYDNFSILQLDAHSDMRDEYEGSPYNHACVMARGKDITSSIVQVGIRSSAIEEKHNIDPERIFYAHEIKELGDTTWMYEISQKLLDNVYVTIDLDVLDPAYMPSTGTPEPDGLSYRDVMTLLKLINERHNIIGLDVVELCPNASNKAPDFLAAKLIYQFLSCRFK